MYRWQPTPFLDVVWSSLIESEIMKLDILTPLGQTTVAEEKIAYAIFEKQRPGYTVQHTDKTKPVPFDGWIIYNGSPVALIETKCRFDVWYDEFVNRYKNRWLITEAKLQVASRSSRKARLPLYGFLYIVKSKVLMVKRLADKDGKLVEREVKDTVTQATVNGGVIKRTNCFVSMNKCTIMQLEERPMPKLSHHSAF